MTKPNLPNPSTNGQGDALDGAAASLHESPTDPRERFSRDGGGLGDGLAADPFDPAALRLSQDFGSTIGVKKVLTVVPCRKPNRHEFVRVRPGEDWRLETGLFEDKLNRDAYLVRRELWGELAGDVYPACLFQAVNRQSDVFLWPVKLLGEGGRTNTWNDSALAAARLAEERWVRIAANMGAGMYDTLEAASELSDPTWPELPFAEILRLCFRGRFIESVEHPVIRALRGLA